MYILAIILTIIIYKIYHKIFNITYFGFKPIISEIVVMFIISLMISGSILGKF